MVSIGNKNEMKLDAIYKRMITHYDGIEVEEREGRKAT
jgi:hypothetical protein